MGAPTLALAVSLLLSAQPEEPQLVVLPLEAEGVKAQLGLDAWKTVVAEVAKAKGKLKIGVTLQKELHDMLLGPAREQARDCGANLDCLRDIGRALDVSQLIAGKVTKDAVSLVALDVIGGQKLGSAKSPASLAGGKIEAKSRAAARALIASMGKTKKGEGAALADASKDPAKDPAKDKAGPRDEAGADAIDPMPDGREAGGSGTTDIAREGDDDLKSDAPERGPEDGSANGASPALASSNEGRIRIAREQLAGIAEISIDGTAVRPDADGSLTWLGLAGSHTVVLVRGDGTRETREVLVEPGQTALVSIPPPAIQPAAADASGSATRIDTPRAREEESVTGKWWFWTAIATAVLAGGATSVVLAGGLKGGPSIPSDAGAISGTY